MKRRPEMRHVLDADARPFGNWFAWSFGTQKTFNACPRRFYLRKVTFWEGWKRSAPKPARLAYRLSKMESLASICGRVVHEMAAWRFADPGVANLPAANRALVSRLRRAVQTAKLERWRDDPKRFPPVAEYYYTGRHETPAEAGPRILDLGYRALENLFRQPEESPALLLPPESPPLLVDFRGVPVWVQFDLAWIAAGKIRLRDWKTGRSRPEHHAQAAVQITLAAEVWGRPAAAELDYLGAGHRETVEDLDVADFIVDAAEDIRGRFDSPDVQAGPADHFPPTTDPTECRQCDMLHLCQKVKDRREADPEKARIPE